MQNYTITTTSNGLKVYANLINSTAAAHINRQPHLLGLIKEALKPHKLTKSEMSIEQDMGRTIGNTDIVETGEKDTVFYAQAYKKHTFLRFVKNRYQTPSQYLSIHLKQDSEGHYEVRDVWIGRFAPPFPDDEQATDLSKAYWQTHALVADAHSIQPKTITRECPY